MLKKMQGNYQLAIISLFGVSVVLGVMPFAVFRFVTGAYGVAALDAAIAVGICAVVAYTWRSGHTRGPGWIMAGITNVGAVLSALMLGDDGLVWIYAVLMANFFLVPRRIALLLALLDIGGLSLHGGAFDDYAHMASFAMSSLVVTMLALILAHWTNFQRRQLEDLATHDALTGLGNRRAMEQDLQRALLLSDRTRFPCGLALVDIDHFKSINDQHGHAAGDATLVAFADLLRSSVRKVDSVYRFGGEEFLLLLPGADVAGLRAVTRTLRARIASSQLGPESNLTASLGAAMLAEGESVDAWLLRADAALYRAKALGRDRACVDGAAEGECTIEHGASEDWEDAPVGATTSGA